MIKKYKAKIRYEHIRDENIKIIKEHLDIEYLECNRCNVVNKHFGFYDFHHINPKTKIKSISYLMGHKNKERLLKEVDKCEILCPSCHREHHLNENKIENDNYNKEIFEINILNKGIKNDI